MILIGMPRVVPSLRGVIRLDIARANLFGAIDHRLSQEQS